MNPTGVQHPIGRPTSSSRQHRSASREGRAAKSTRERARRRAREPACTQRKNRRRSAGPPLRVPPGGWSAGGPRHRADAASRARCRAVRASKRPRTVWSPVRLAETGRGSLFEASTNTTLVRRQKPTAGLLACARLSPYWPHRPSQGSPPSAEFSAKRLRPSVPRELQCAIDAQLISALCRQLRQPKKRLVACASARFSLLDGIQA